MILKDLKRHLASPRANPPAEKFLDEFCGHLRDNDELEYLLEAELNEDMPALVEAMADYAQRRMDGEIT